MIVGKRIQLRAIELEDLSFLVKWRNDQDVYQYFFEHEPLSQLMQERWFENFLKKTDEKFWIIETIEDLDPIGTIGIVHIDYRNRKAEWGRFLIYSDKYRHGGYGSEALSLILRYSFEHMNLNRLYCEVFKDNQPVIHLYKKFGFQEEGKFRQHIFKNGQYSDVVYLALLKDDYVSNSCRIIKKYLEE